MNRRWIPALGRGPSADYSPPPKQFTFLRQDNSECEEFPASVEEKLLMTEFLRAVRQCGRRGGRRGIAIDCSSYIYTMYGAILSQAANPIRRGREIKKADRVSVKPIADLVAFVSHHPVFGGITLRLYIPLAAVGETGFLSDLHHLQNYSALIRWIQPPPVNVPDVRFYHDTVIIGEATADNFAIMSCDRFRDHVRALPHSQLPPQEIQARLETIALACIVIVEPITKVREWSGTGHPQFTVTHLTLEFDRGTSDLFIQPLHVNSAAFEASVRAMIEFGSAAVLRLPAPPPGPLVPAVPALGAPAVPPPPPPLDALMQTLPNFAIPPYPLLMIQARVLTFPAPVVGFIVGLAQFADRPRSQYRHLCVYLPGKGFYIRQRAFPQPRETVSDVVECALDAAALPVQKILSYRLAEHQLQSLPADIQQEILSISSNASGRLEMDCRAYFRDREGSNRLLFGDLKFPARLPNGSGQMTVRYRPPKYNSSGVVIEQGRYSIISLSCTHPDPPPWRFVAVEGASLRPEVTSQARYIEFGASVQSHSTGMAKDGLVIGLSRFQSSRDLDRIIPLEAAIRINLADPRYSPPNVREPPSGEAQTAGPSAVRDLPVTAMSAEGNAGTSLLEDSLLAEQVVGSGEPPGKRSRDLARMWSMETVASFMQAEGGSETARIFQQQAFDGAAMLILLDAPGEVETFVAKHFPLHGNSLKASKAVRAFKDLLIREGSLVEYKCPVVVKRERTPATSRGGSSEEVQNLACSMDK